MLSQNTTPDPNYPIPDPINPTPRKEQDWQALDRLLTEVQSSQQVEPNESSLAEETHENFAFQPPSTESVPEIKQPSNQERLDQREISELETAIDSFAKQTQNLPQNKGTEVAVNAQAKTENYEQPPVVVLPTTREQIDTGKSKSPTYGLKWLAEWCRKMIKKFSGRYVYKDSTEAEKID